MDTPSTRRQLNLKPIKPAPKGRGPGSGFLGGLLKDLGSVVRGPSFLYVVSLILLLTIPASQATLLKGYLQSTDEVADEPQPSASVKGSQPAWTDFISPAEAAVQRRMSGLQALIKAQSFPPSFAGTWKCMTVVINSALASVPVGQRVESQISFVSQPDGRVLAAWEQPGWTQAQQQVVPVSLSEASLDRTNYYVADSSQGLWAAHSRDHYLQIDQNRMTADSIVEQFISGQFLGRYLTKSMLYRL